MASYHGTAVSASPFLEIFADSGTNSPGTLLAEVQLATTSFAANGTSLYTYTPAAAPLFTVPTNGTVWAGLFFKSGTAAAGDRC